ncbi:hypothetical protein WJX72_010328 [[Myrmecia] bisecta]|uniref:Fungal lipase-type domain-containing protein n=1 Tax=[Myrmecia] bisecta TaxID=41462 RepID=A0AAW1PE22_9CHLO
MSKLVSWTCPAVEEYYTSSGLSVADVANYTGETVDTKGCNPSELHYTDALSTADMLAKANLCVGATCLAALLGCLAVLLTKLVARRRRGEHWGPQARRLATIYVLELCVVILNMLFYLANNIVVLAKDFCTFITGLNFIYEQWSCWTALFALTNIQARASNPWEAPSQAEGVVPWRKHLPTFVAWFCAQAGVIAVPLILQHTTCRNKPDCPIPVWGGAHVSRLVEDYRRDVCQERVFPLTCQVDVGFALLALALVLPIVVFFIWYVVLEHRLLQQLMRHDYDEFRELNVEVRFQLRLRMRCFAELLLNVLLLWFVAYGKCTSVMETWFGLMPMQVTITALTIAGLIQNIPVSEAAFEKRTRKVYWTEAERDSLPPEHLPSSCFCFETAVKLCYWSALCYDYVANVGKSQAPLPKAGKLPCGAMPCGCPLCGFGCCAIGGDTSDTDAPDDVASAAAAHPAPDVAKIANEPVCQKGAMELFGLTHFEHVTDPATDNHVLMGWSSRVIVIAFRGTDSTPNLYTDIQLFPSPIPDSSGSRLASLVNMLLRVDALHPSRPEVHRGFGRAFYGSKHTMGPLQPLPLDVKASSTTPQPQALGFHIWRRIFDILTITDDHHGQISHIYVTGHSLGGGLALISAFEIARKLQALRPSQHPCVRCYPFAAPRTGNAGFARLHRQLVPDTWNIINDADIITTWGKFWGTYKRCGERCLISAAGHLIVQPSFVEISAQHVVGQYHNLLSFLPDLRLARHRLSNYAKALLAILLCRCGADSVPDTLSRASFLPELMEVTNQVFPLAHNAKVVFVRLASWASSASTSEHGTPVGTAHTPEIVQARIAASNEADGSV